MKKQVTKIELDGKPIGTKPLLLDDTLTSLREKIQDKIKVSFLFLDKEGNIINKENENDYTLEKINEGKVLKVKSEEGQSGINILLNETKICSDNFSNSQCLAEIRNLLQRKIEDEFSFIDQDGNPIDKNDESDLKVEDILNNNSIKLKGSKKKVKKEKKDLNFSKYEKINQKVNLTFYKYSNLERQSNHKLVYQYFYDKYDALDYNNAYVVLFCGKTGDGKTTAINAFFNIIKGVELEDNYRFILVTEPQKKKGQAESQTDGVHIYYLKDYNNKPVIIIDSQGYGDTRGKAYDDMIDEAFRFIFSHVIDHINTALFIVKSNTNRIDILTKYIFSSVTSLFSEDISENFLILATFANKETITKGPAFVDSIQTDADFLKINERMNENWWYAIESTNILDNDNDKLTKYSFEKANELYENKVKKLRPKSIKKCAEVLNSRMEIKVQVSHLVDTFQHLINEQYNLGMIEENINKKSEKIKDIQNRKNELEQSIKEYGLEYNSINMVTENDMNKRSELIRRKNEELNSMLNDLDNMTELRRIKKLKYYSGSKCTHCDNCEKNCHELCSCLFNTILGRCKIFSFWKKICQECGCSKEDHKQDYYYYTYEVVEDKKKSKEKKMTQEKDKEKAKSILEELDEFQKSSEKLENERKKNIEEQENTKTEIQNISKQILFIIIQLHKLSDILNDIAMNNNHIKNEEEYIDDLITKMDKMNLNEDEMKEKIKVIKKNNEILINALKLNIETLTKLTAEQLAEKLKIMIPTNKKH